MLNAFPQLKRKDVTSVSVLGVLALKEVEQSLRRHNMGDVNVTQFDVVVESVKRTDMSCAMTSGRHEASVCMEVLFVPPGEWPVGDPLLKAVCRVVFHGRKGERSTWVSKRVEVSFEDVNKKIVRYVDSRESFRFWHTSVQ